MFLTCAKCRYLSCFIHWHYTDQGNYGNIHKVIKLVTDKDRDSGSILESVTESEGKDQNTLTLLTQSIKEGRRDKDIKTE